MFFRFRHGGKLCVRDRLIGGLHWTGTEQIPGCRLRQRPRARRRREASHHRACHRRRHLERRGPLSTNWPDTAAANARAEGVLDRVQLRTGDARDLPFPAASFHTDQGPRRRGNRAGRNAPRLEARRPARHLRHFLRGLICEHVAASGRRTSPHVRFDSALVPARTPHHRAQSGPAQDRIIFPETT